MPQHTLRAGDREEDPRGAAPPAPGRGAVGGLGRERWPLPLPAWLLRNLSQLSFLVRTVLIQTPPLLGCPNRQSGACRDAGAAGNRGRCAEGPLAQWCPRGLRVLSCKGVEIAEENRRTVCAVGSERSASGPHLAASDESCEGKPRNSSHLYRLNQGPSSSGSAGAA